MDNYITQLEQAIRSLGRNVADRYPPVRTPVLRGWHSYRVAYSRFVCFRDSLQYARHTDLSPFEVVSVDPDRIEYLVEQNGYPSQTYENAEFPDSKFKYAGTVRGGDWDSREMQFEDTDLYRAFEAHFERGVAWSDTAFFDRVVEHVENGVVLWGCASEAEFEQRCARLDDLYESIRDRGYLSRRDLARSAAGTPTTDTPSSAISPCVYDEIAVCVGRDGDVLFFDGRNRLAIAKLLGLDAIPVWIMVRHERWQALRESLAAGRSPTRELPGCLQEHPDLQSVLS